MARVKKEITEGNEKIGKWANAFRIICNVFKVFCIIGIICLALVMVLVPGMMKKIKISEDKIVVFDQTIEFRVEEVDFLTYSINGGKEQKINSKDISKILETADLKNISTSKIRNVIMISLGFAIIMLVIEYMILRALSKLLDRIRTEEVSFVEGGSKVLVNVMWMLLANYLLSIVLGLIVAISFAGNKTNINFSINLMYILMLCVIYFVSLLYKHGEQLEN